MTKQDVKQIMRAYYPEVGEDKYVPKLPEISEDALVELEAIIQTNKEMFPGSLEHTNEILLWIGKVKKERAKI